ncbi:hypothetical protein IFM89_034592 [Coptis chinensis]|uniref:Glycoside hydrolase family 5 domain-containing protein n=1 Tax=Coptis chinensis TaxID=261450 RepID=A0A835HRI3_9MAGN|nr:hypothetical protein IFM89_034592 [Coptis chinensis]
MHVVVAFTKLYTDGRYLLDEPGHRVKLACVNWPSHLETMLPEGLHKQPLDSISKKIVAMGFNCVRLTWSVDMAMDLNRNKIIVETFKSLGLDEAIAGIQANNPDFLNLDHMKAFVNVVNNLGDNNVMVILDNHISKAGWCCSNNDGNGFFGDQYFDPERWLQGLRIMAFTFGSTKNVVGMSLRNELRGPNQNAGVWERYMRDGALVINEENPNVLVIISGLNYDLDLSFLKLPLVNITDGGKLLFEIHHYGVSDGNAWMKNNANEMCGHFRKTFADTATFLMEEYPLFLSEFGGDLRGTNENDNRFLNCMFGIIVELDLDWAWWALQGSYYFREGQVGVEEVYGVLDKDWNETFAFDPLSLNSCVYSEKWDYTTEKIVMLKGTQFCLQASDLGQSPKLDVDCNNPRAKWEKTSESEMHLSSTLPNGDRVCLDVDDIGKIVTNPCKCLKRDSNCDPASQWFNIIKSDTSH